MNYTSIRYGKMRMVARFKTEREDLRRGDRCLIRTDRGKEVGEVLTAVQPLPEAIPPESLWDVMRRASPEDLVQAERLEKESVPRARQQAREIIKKLNIQMKLTEVDYIMGGERIIFYFTSPTRVDFRELVRHLAHEFRTRIELKQVGSRDEARLVGDIGHCGLTLCCRGHLKELGGFTMDMAKIQKHTADPSKITGRCGKLLCCLRYEYSTYTEARDVLPGRGKRITAKTGQEGFVVDQNSLLREVTIEVEGGDRVIVKLEEIAGAAPTVAGCSGCSTPAASVAPAPPPAVVAAPPLAGGPAPVTAGPPPVPVPAVKAMWMSLGRVSDFPAGSGKVEETGGPRVAVFNVEGKVHVIGNDCPHQGGPLGEGQVEGTVVTCPLHQWKFDFAAGTCLSVPGSIPRKYETVTMGDDVYIKV